MPQKPVGKVALITGGNSGLVLFLATDNSSYVTGIELFVDGGMGQIRTGRAALEQQAPHRTLHPTGAAVLVWRGIEFLQRPRQVRKFDASTGARAAPTDGNSGLIP